MTIWQAQMQPGWLSSLNDIQAAPAPVPSVPRSKRPKRFNRFETVQGNVRVRSKVRLTLAQAEDARPNPRRVDHVYMAVADHGEGEGVYTVVGPSGERLPIVAIDDPGLSALREYSQELANSSGTTVSIICFTRRTRHATFSPLTTGDKET